MQRLTECVDKGSFRTKRKLEDNNDDESLRLQPEEGTKDA